MLSFPFLRVVAFFCFLFLRALLGALLVAPLMVCACMRAVFFFFFFYLTINYLHVLFASIQVLTFLRVVDFFFAHVSCGVFDAGLCVCGVVCVC